MTDQATNNETTTVLIQSDNTMRDDINTFMESMQANNIDYTSYSTDDNNIIMVIKSTDSKTINAYIYYLSGASFIDTVKSLSDYDIIEDMTHTTT